MNKNYEERKLQLFTALLPHIEKLTNELIIDEKDYDKLFLSLIHYAEYWTNIWLKYKIVFIINSEETRTQMEVEELKKFGVSGAEKKLIKFAIRVQSISREILGY